MYAGHGRDRLIRAKTATPDGCRIPSVEAASTPPVEMHPLDDPATRAAQQARLAEFIDELEVDDERVDVISRELAERAQHWPE